jgi:hypothetical protein
MDVFGWAILVRSSKSGFFAVIGRKKATTDSTDHTDEGADLAMLAAWREGFYQRGVGVWGIARIFLQWSGNVGGRQGQCDLGRKILPIMRRFGSGRLGVVTPGVQHLVRRQVDRPSFSTGCGLLCL